MALRVSATMALCLLFSLMAAAHCVPFEADLATNASSIAIPAAEVHAVPDGQGLRLPSSDDSVVSDAVVHGEEVPVEEEALKPVAEPDPDRSHLEGQRGDEKTKEQIDDDEDEDEEVEKKKIKKNHDGDGKEEKKKKRKKHHDCDGKGKKEKKKLKKHHQSNGEEEEEEEKEKKQIDRHRHVEEEKTKKRPHHHKKNKNGNDSDDEEEQQEKTAKRWRKAVSRNMFGHGRRSQREESQTDEVKN